MVVVVHLSFAAAAVSVRFSLGLGLGLLPCLPCPFCFICFSLRQIVVEAVYFLYSLVYFIALTMRGQAF